MFLDRLFEMFGKIVVFSLSVAGACGIVWIFLSLPYNLGSWIMLGIIAVMLLIGVIAFIHWLIIEPIQHSNWYQRKKWKKNQSK